MNPIYRRTCLLLSLLFFSSQFFSQKNEIDSLKSALILNSRLDTNRINTLYRLAFASFQKDENITKAYLKEVTYLSDSLNYPLGKAKQYYLRGILQSRKSNYPESLNLFQQSLKHYESINNKKGIASVYSAFGITHFVQSEYEEALCDYKRASEVFKEFEDKKELVSSLIRIGNVYAQLGRYDEAISNYNQALSHSENIDNEFSVVNIYSSLGVVYKNQGNYPLAIEYYNKTLEYHEENKDTLGTAVSNNNLGDAYTSIKKYDDALKYHMRSLKYASQIGNKSLIATNTNNLGNIYLAKKEYSTALKYYNTSLKTSNEVNQLEQMMLCYHNIGELNLILGKSTEARENFSHAEDISHKIGSKRGLSYSLLGIAETYLVENNNKKAYIYAQKGKKYALELKIIETEKKAEELLFNIYKNTGQYQKALQSHQQYKKLNDSLFNKENIERITQLEYEHKYKQELESANNRELKLTQKVKVTSSNLERSQRNLLIGVILFLSVFLILISIIFLLRLRTIKSETQNIIIEQKLLRSQMTPHFIFNALSVLQGIILNKENKKAVLYLSKFSKLLRITLENSRDKMVSLNQELAAVENYVTLQNLEVNNPYNYSVLVDSIIDQSQFKIPPMLIQPFIENAIEHGFENKSQGKKIEIYLQYSNNKLTCTITDNGIGIESQKGNKSQNKTSLSTTITAERLKLLSQGSIVKGAITIEDRKKENKQGTIVTLTIPYKIDTEK